MAHWHGEYVYNPEDWKLCSNKLDGDFAYRLSQGGKPDKQLGVSEKDRLCI